MFWIIAVVNHSGSPSFKVIWFLSGIKLESYGGREVFNTHTAMFDKINLVVLFCVSTPLALFKVLIWYGPNFGINLFTTYLSF